MSENDEELGTTMADDSGAEMATGAGRGFSRIVVPDPMGIVVPDPAALPDPI